MLRSKKTIGWWVAALFLAAMPAYAKQSESESQSSEAIQQDEGSQAIQDDHDRRQLKRHRDLMSQMERHLSVLSRQLESREREYEKATVETTAAAMFPREQLKQQVADLLRQRSELRIQLAGLQSAEEHLAALRKEAKQGRQEAYMREIEIARQILLQREENVARTKQLAETGMTSTEEVTSARTELLRAQAELEQLVRQAKDDSQGPFSAAVFENSMELARVSAQLKALEAELDEWKERQQVHHSLIEVQKQAIQAYLEKAYVQKMEREDQLNEARLQWEHARQQILEAQDKGSTIGSDK